MATRKKVTETEKIKKTSEKLLKLLEIEGSVEVKEAEEGVDIVLETPESGIVIGRHGETLDALQLVLSLCIAKELDRFVRITLEVGDWRKSRTSWLQDIAEDAKVKALSQDREITLPQLKPWERRIIHLFLQNDEKVTSESVGEGQERTLVVKPR